MEMEAITPVSSERLNGGVTRKSQTPTNRELKEESQNEWGRDKSSYLMFFNDRASRNRHICVA